jgi:hypothetical protein
MLGGIHRKRQKFLFLTSFRHDSHLQVFQLSNFHKIVSKFVLFYGLILRDIKTYTQ